MRLSRLRLTYTNKGSKNNLYKSQISHRKSKEKHIQCFKGKEKTGGSDQQRRGRCDLMKQCHSQTIKSIFPECAGHGATAARLNTPFGWRPQPSLAYETLKQTLTRRQTQCIVQIASSCTLNSRQKFAGSQLRVTAATLGLCLLDVSNMWKEQKHVDIFSRVVNLIMR